MERVMSRMHLFEWEDQRWFPPFLRNAMTEFLAFLSHRTGMFQPVVPMILSALRHAPIQRIVDLGSGSGGGLAAIADQLKAEHGALELLFTDYFPNEHGVSVRESFHPVPVDARAVPSELTGLRTMFLSFHHFRPDEARAILQNAVDAAQPIATFEAQDRGIGSLLAMVFSPVTVVLVTPLIRPFSWKRLLFTYVVPVIPLCVMWDGVVSSLRTYAPVELQALIEGLEGGAKFEWTVGQVKSGPSRITYLVGVPATPVVPELDVTA